MSKGATSSTTFYYTKDIQYLLHEPLLTRFREHKALSKKIARSLGKGEYGDAARLDKKDSAKLSLDHIIKERYPTFADALRDLDDALSLLFLFSNLPSTSNVPPKTIRLCQKLCHEFQHYIILSHSLRKSFLSIKGIYYQATLQGQDVMWLVPYKFVQRVTSDVDFRIMGTFVEFYTTLLGFVNYRLYSSIGLVYPPKFNAKSDERGAELGAFTVEGINLAGDDETIQVEANGVRQQERSRTEIDISHENSEQALQNAILAQTEAEDIAEAEKQPALIAESNGDIDTFVATADGADILPQPQISHFDAGRLFDGMHFFISRESPRQPLEFIVKAFGCKRVSWPEILGDGSFTHDENDTTITHQIVDRPSIPVSNDDIEKSVSQARAGLVIPGRIYVQPQWVWDCINSNKLLRPDLYGPGAVLPPHLSPWIKLNHGLYDPSLPLAEQEEEGEADDAVDMETTLLPPTKESMEAEAEEPEEESRPDDDHGMQIASDDDSDDDLENDYKSDEILDNDEIEFTEALEDEATSGPEIPADKVHWDELAAEVSGKDAIAVTKDPDAQARKEARKIRQRKKQGEEEELQRQLGMMSKKKRKLYEKMRYSNQQKENDAAKLRAKRRKLEQP